MLVDSQYLDLPIDEAFRIEATHIQMCINLLHNPSYRVMVTYVQPDGSYFSQYVSGLDGCLHYMRANHVVNIEMYISMITSIDERKDLGLDFQFNKVPAPKMKSFTGNRVRAYGNLEMMRLFAMNDESIVVRSYVFERSPQADESSSWYWMIKAVTPEEGAEVTTVQDVVNTLNAFRGTEDFAEYPEAVSRKIGSLVKELEKYLEDDGVEREIKS